MKINEYSDTIFIESTIDLVNGRDILIVAQNRKTTVKEIKELYYNRCLSVADIGRKLDIGVGVVNKVVNELMDRKLIT